MNEMKQRGITRIKFMVSDINGHQKFMLIPQNYFEEAVEGIGIDGSSIPGYTTVDNSDLIAKPDVERAVFLKDEVIIFCDVQYNNGTAFGGDPRGILKKVLDQGLKTMKSTFYAKPELEFFLFAGKTPMDTKGYMEYAPGLRIVEDAVATIDVAVERIHHENGPGQYEIEPVIAPALKACDTIILLKEVLTQAAEEHQVTANFMPKPLEDEAGSGMHFHVLAEKDGENLFESFSECARYFVGGVLAHARGITAICNPTINSYKRLVPNFEAPVHITWGRGNRSTLIRIPGVGKTRIEYRAPDPSCNPYLALAVIIGAGMDGIQKKIEPPEESAEDVFESETGDTLPATLGQAVDILEKDDVVKEILGTHLVRAFITLKKKEIFEYTTHISQWEWNHYH